MNKQFAFLVCLFLLPMTSHAQEYLQGQVLDANTGTPLAGATVQFPGTGQGDITNTQGLFSLPLLGDSLIASYLGYRSDTLTVLQSGVFYTIALQAGRELPVVTAQARRTTIDLNRAASVQRIESAQIEQTDQLNPSVLFNQVPGVFMQTGALNTNRITIRGVGNRNPFGTAKIRAYLNDIPLTNGVGETVLEDIDLSLIDRMEIRRGPTGSSYGAGLGGLIRYQTAEQQAEAPQFALQQQVGSYNTRRTTARASLPATSQPLQLDLTFNQVHSDGYRDNNTYDRTSFTALGQYGNNQRDRATVFINYNDVKAFIPSSLNRTDYLENPTRAAFTWDQVSGFEDYERLLAGLSHRREWLSLSAKNSLQSSFSLFGTVRSNYEVRPFNILREDNRALGLRTQWEYRPSASQSLPLGTVGVEYYDERYDWTTNETMADGDLGALLSDQLENRRYYNLFAEVNWSPARRWLFTAGINLNETHYTLTDRFTTTGQGVSGNYQFDPVWSPRLNLAYRLTPRINLYTTLSHGFSPPSLEETLNPDGTRNPDIQPERGWNLEMGSRGSYLGGQISYEFTLYRMRITDLLVARRTALDQFTGINAGGSIHQGIEAQVGWQDRRTPETFARISYTFSDYFFDTFVDGDNDFSGNELTGQPRHQAGVEAQWQMPLGFYLHGRYRFTGAFPIRDDNSLYSEAWQTVDFRVGWQGTLGARWQVSPYVAVQNALDEQYASMILINATGFGGAAPRYYYPGLPRNFYAGIRLEYQIEE